MAISQAVANSFKSEILQGIHDLESGGDAFKLALYTSAATIGADTTSYAVGYWWTSWRHWTIRSRWRSIS